MDDVTGRAFGQGELVETDGKTFTECSFNSAMLAYRGGEHPRGTDDVRAGDPVVEHVDRVLRAHLQAAPDGVHGVVGRALGGEVGHQSAGALLQGGPTGLPGLFPVPGTVLLVPRVGRQEVVRLKAGSRFGGRYGGGGR